MIKGIAIKAIFFLCFTAFLVSCNDETGKIKNPAEAAEIQQLLENSNSEVYNTQLSNTEKVNEIYESREFQPVWNNSQLREEFLENIQNASKEGLQYSDYHGNALDKLLEDSSINNETSAALDILLTDAFFKYSGHLLNGKINPESLYDLWGVKRDNVDRIKLLKNAINNNQIAESIDSLRPHHPIYKSLMGSLEEYGKRTNKIIDIEDEGKIESGDEDERIPAIAKRLQELELLDSNISTEGNIYSEEIVEAVKNFQEQLGLAKDGIIGQSTIEELNKDDSERYKQIMVNLERWRWYPRDLGDHYILVNIPDYKVAVVKDNDTVSTRRAIVGKEERGTPIFTDTVSYVVFNPTWTIPPTILEQDIIPAAQGNSGYLASKEIQVMDKEGNSVDYNDIDWDNAANYTFQQKAGANNPLGQVKIIYPNQYSIYLHDTPGKQKFEENDRAASSGCVRVENAVDLAEYVLSDQQDWDSNRIQEVLASGETTQVPVEQKIMVHHLYYTAWTNNGETKFTNDIYDLDDEVFRKLRE